MASPISTGTEPLTPHLDIPVERVWPWRFWVVTGLILGFFVTVGSWKAGLIQPSKLWARKVKMLQTVPVDEGTLFVVITENGSLESSNNATIRCQVEALIGLVGGAAQGGGAAAGGGRPGGVGGGAQGGRGGAGGQGQQQQQQQQPAPSASKKKAQTGAGATGKNAAGGGGASSALVSGGANAAGGANASGGGSNNNSGGGSNNMAGGSGGTSGGGASSGGATTTTPVSTKPVIRSFSYAVPPYQPLRPKAAGGAQQPIKQAAADPNMAGGGRRGGGGGGGRGGDPNNAEKPGSTRIISILPEGTRVKAGQVVCELDSAAFRDEVQAQKIRWEQAKALVDQAGAILDVNQITYEEYRDGIYPQDMQLLRQYVTTCAIDTDRAKKNLDWSRQTQAKGYRSAAQVKADLDGYEEARLSEHEAQQMLSRLELYTGPRLKKNLLAKIEAIKADKLAQDSVFQLESDRLRRLELMVSNCTLRAPRDGIVVYANVANNWGQTQNPIDQGVTVRQGQALINLPDPNHMQVRTRINESKVSAIRIGQKARILVDAFPDRPMMGTVESITPIPAPTGRSGQDVRVYYATVEIDSGGFDDLRPGLSAEVTFQVDPPHKVTRLPLQAVRFFHEIPYAAVVPAGSNVPQWRELKVGQSDTNYMEILSGVVPGDRVLARPDQLDAPVRSVAEARPFSRPQG